MAVTFAGAESCDGHYGLYHHSESAPEVTICTELDFVYEHELAHAWAAFWTSDERRSRFMEICATSAWNDPSADWGDRGVEQAAFVIQQTLALPLPTIQGREFENRVAAFEALTGMGDPRLAQTPSLDPA